MSICVGHLTGKQKEALKRAQVLAEAQNFARTIAYRPGNQVNPPELARICLAAGRQVGLKCRVIDERAAGKLGMGGLLSVGAASKTPPRMIILEHKPAKAKGKPILLVGKSITFDTGGISIKPADKMGRMIFDKCGGMAVLATLVAVAKMKLPLHVVGILPAAENHVSGAGYRPGDVIKMHNGVTVEVTNTDAEGRLVLADGLSWALRPSSPGR